MERFQVPPADQFRLSDYDPADTRGLDDASIRRILNENRKRIAELQNVLYAEGERSLLLILQSMDTGGKDPVIRDVLNLSNQQACRVTAFKKPEGVEKKHDRFWRFHRAMPQKGEIGVFNRAYFDDIIRSHAHGEIGPQKLEKHYRQINAFESVLADSDISIVKIFLHISKEEQRRRLQERIDNPERHWELSESDFSERAYWDGYMTAYEAMIRATNTEHAPWYLIPADHRDFRDAAASMIICSALEALHPRFPPAEIDLESIEWH
jgi:PPK2 family polyphosphate:nucleotide phosphotransferase